MQNFSLLVNAVQDTHSTMQQNAAKAINTYLTIRNWLIGFYIVEFEQNGEDRAQYGGKLLEKLSDSLQHDSFSQRNLRLFRQFYLSYSPLAEPIKNHLGRLNFFENQIRHSPIAKLLAVDNESNGEIFLHEQALSLKELDALLTKLSYTHLVQLLPITDLTKRNFYERECMQANWSVSELKRQINTLYYERSQLSRQPEKLKVPNSPRPQISDLIKSPFTFEFLGLKAKDVVYENELEQALVDNLEAFLIELGHGFCFEAKQKRLVIGGEYFYVDLVFYHRILKCHVLVELKTHEAKHEHIGQLKTYINYYKKEIMIAGDNPPVGLLLVTDQNRALVEYAVADSDTDLFVSKYLVELPTKEQLVQFINNELAAKGGI